MQLPISRRLAVHTKSEFFCAGQPVNLLLRSFPITRRALSLSACVCVSNCLSALCLDTTDNVKAWAAYFIIYQNQITYVISKISFVLFIRDYQCVVVFLPDSLAAHRKNRPDAETIAAHCVLTKELRVMARPVWKAQLVNVGAERKQTALCRKLARFAVLPRPVWTQHLETDPWAGCQHTDNETVMFCLCGAEAAVCQGAPS